MARIMSTKKIIPNPKPPKMPMVEILSATPPNSRHMTTLHSAQIAFGNFVCSQNVKETGKEPPSLYLEINERRKKADKWETHRILVFDDVLLEFVQELKKAARFIADRALAN